MGHLWPLRASLHVCLDVAIITTELHFVIAEIGGATLVHLDRDLFGRCFMPSIKQALFGYFADMLGRRRRLLGSLVLFALDT